MKTRSQTYAVPFGHVLPLLVSVLFVTILPSCVSTSERMPAVSLEEAKRITATFAQGFTPPPRTINDVTAILSQERPADLASYEKALAISDQTPPAGKDDLELAHFYFNRSRARLDLGLGRKAKEDLRLALQYGLRSKSELLRSATFVLGAVEAGDGNFTTGIQPF